MSGVLCGVPYRGRWRDDVRVKMSEDSTTSRRRQCALLMLLAITTPCHVSLASPAVSAAAASSTTDVDLLMPSVRPQVVSRRASVNPLDTAYLFSLQSSTSVTPTTLPFPKNGLKWNHWKLVYFLRRATIVSSEYLLNVIDCFKASCFSVLSLLCKILLSARSP